MDHFKLPRNGNGFEFSKIGDSSKSLIHAAKERGIFDRFPRGRVVMERFREKIFCYTKHLMKIWSCEVLQANLIKLKRGEISATEIEQPILWIVKPNALSI
jgi:hypothetical protein